MAIHRPLRHAAIATIREDFRILPLDLTVLVRPGKRSHLSSLVITLYVAPASCSNIWQLNEYTRNASATPFRHTPALLSMLASGSLMEDFSLESDASGIFRHSTMALECAFSFFPWPRRWSLQSRAVDVALVLLLGCLFLSLSARQS